MKYKLVDFPRYFPPEKYEAVIEKICRFLINQDEVISVYKLGSIGDPGISDVDLIAVFKDGAKCYVNPLSVLDRNESYAFRHSIFGIGEAFCDRIQRYSLFKNVSWYWGTDFKWEVENTNQELKRQVALEYLMSNFMARTRDKEYRLLRIRNLLLSSHAIRYDLELLNISSGILHEKIQELKRIRKKWFEFKSGGEEISSWFETFYPAFNLFLFDYFKTNKLSVPEIRPVRFSRNISLIPGSSLKYEFNGLVLPAFSSSSHKKLRKINDLVNRFRFFVPMKDFSSDDDSVLFRRNTFFKRMMQTHREAFPYFAPMANNLQIKLLT